MITSDDRARHARACGIKWWTRPDDTAIEIETERQLGMGTHIIRPPIGSRRDMDSATTSRPRSTDAIEARGRVRPRLPGAQIRDVKRCRRAANLVAMNGRTASMSASVETGRLRQGGVRPPNDCGPRRGGPEY